MNIPNNPGTPGTPGTPGHSRKPDKPAPNTGARHLTFAEKVQLGNLLQAKAADHTRRDFYAVLPPELKERVTIDSLTTYARELGVRFLHRDQGSGYRKAPYATRIEKMEEDVALLYTSFSDMEARIKQLETYIHTHRIGSAPLLRKVD